LTPTK
jgi:hypothetical protein